MASTSYLKDAQLKDKMPESWDIEVCHEGEADLYKHHKSCKKHPDHELFIPVDKFNINHLPMDYQDNDIVEYIKLVAQLTVRLTVRYVSPNRPATIPDTDKPYPFYENRGRNVMSVGTGMITHVYEDWISIKTSAHVVFDRDEAKHTSYHLFYDNGDLPAVCNTAIEIEFNKAYIYSNIIVDESIVWIKPIWSEQVVDKIKSFFSKMLELRTKIINRISERSYDRQNQPLTFIVSHPHGCSKTICIGRCVEVDDNLDDVRFLYTTPTCPGSSGAAVICLDKLARNLNSTHSGIWKDGASLNLGSGRYFLLEPTACHNRSHEGYKDRRLPDSLCSELCPLPHELNYNLMYNYIHMWSYLCVDVHVNYVSKKRPEFWPGSELPYPWYKKGGSRKKRRGCGWVDRVDIYPNESSPSKTSCDCDKCRNSSTPENNYAHIYILTSTSLVFDQTEGRKTICDVFFDDLDSLRGTQPVSSDVETDRCQLVFVTHYLNLANKLNIFLEYVSVLKEKIQDKLFPHLSSKPLSMKIGRWRDTTLGRCFIVDKHLVYTNKDRQDDVGAPIILLGKKHLHVEVSGHTGQYPLDSKLGYSRYLEYRYK